MARLPTLKETEQKSQTRSAWEGLRAKQAERAAEEGDPVRAPLVRTKEPSATEQMPTTIPTEVMEKPQATVAIPEVDLGGASNLIPATAKALADDLNRRRTEKAEDVSLAQERIRELTEQGLNTDYIAAARDVRRRAGVDAAESELDSILEEISARTEALEIGKAKGARAVADLAGTGRGIPLSIVRGKQERLRQQQMEAENIELAKIGKLTALAALKQNKVTQATELAKEAFALENKAKEVNLATEKEFLNRNYTEFDETQRELATARLKAIDEESELLDLKAKIKLNAFTSGAGQAVMDRIDSAETKKDLLSMPGVANYLMSQAEKLEIALKGQQLANARLAYDTALKEAAALDANGGVDIKQLEGDKDVVKLKGITELKTALKTYDSMVQTYGAAKKGTETGNKLDAQYQEVLQAYRAAKELGALQGADLGLVEDAVKRATWERQGGGGLALDALNVVTLGGVNVAQSGITKSRTSASIEQALSIAETNQERQRALVESKRPQYRNSSYYNIIAGYEDPTAAAAADGINVSDDGIITIDGAALDSNASVLNGIQLP